MDYLILQKKKINPNSILIFSIFLLQILEVLFYIHLENQNKYYCFSESYGFRFSLNISKMDVASIWCF